MAAKWLTKHFRMKPEVNKIFDDIDAYRDYCRKYMLKFDEKDLYKTDQYRKFDRIRTKHNKQQG
jgi:hypothetical protein